MNLSKIVHFSTGYSRSTMQRYDMNRIRLPSHHYTVPNAKLFKHHKQSGICLVLLASLEYNLDN